MKIVIGIVTDAFVKNKFLGDCCCLKWRDACIFFKRYKRLGVLDLPCIVYRSLRKVLRRMAIVAVPSIFISPFPLDYEFLGGGVPQDTPKGSHIWCSLLSPLPLPTTPHYRHPYGLFSDVSVN